MAFKPEAQSSIERHYEEETAAGSGKPDNVDALVTDFLAQLESIASEAKSAPQPPASEKLPVDSPAMPEPRLTLRTRIPMTQEVGHADAKLGLEEINRQIEATLDELERLNAGPISQPDSMDSPPQQPSPPAADSMKSAAESPARQTVQKSAPTATRKTEEQEWKKIDIFRTEVIPSRSSKRRRNIFIALVAAAMVLFLLYLYIFREI